MRLISQMRWLGKLVGLFFSMNMRSTINYYRWSFVWVYIAHVLGYINSYIIIWGSMRSFDGIGAWSMQDVMFLYTFDLLSYSLANMFAQPFWNWDELVGKGKLDDYLIRPMSPLLHVVLRDIQFGYIAHISVSIGAFALLLHYTNALWGGMMFAQFGIALIGAFLIQVSFGILPSCIGFRWIRADQLASLVRWDSRNFIQYPIVIYPAWLRFVLSSIIPIAFVNYYPSLTLLQKDSPIGMYGPLCTLAIGVTLLVLTLVVWKKSLRRYSSSG